jgi:electron transfer flavoprotein beta subunit
MEVLVCVKRVPTTGGWITLTPDEQDIDTRFSGWTVSPHEECAVEEAVRLVEAHGGSSTVLTLGPPEAEEQLRDALAVGVNEAVLLEADGTEWDPQETAAAIAEAVASLEAERRSFDLLVFGYEAADTSDLQVGIRVAHALGRPCVAGAKALEIRDATAVVRREAPNGGWEVLEAPMPAVVTVKEGINLPRYPSVPGRIRAKKKEIQRLQPERAGARLRKRRLVLPSTRKERGAEILGHGPEAAPKVVEVLRGLGLVP